MKPTTISAPPLAGSDTASVPQSSENSPMAPAAPIA